MKTIKSKFFALAFVALGAAAGITSCGKDDGNDKTTSSFPGRYEGTHQIAGGVISVEDTVTIKEGANASTVVFHSQKLGQEFEATVSGNRATIGAFSADSMVVGENTFYGISVGSGFAILSGDKLSITLKDVKVNNGTLDLRPILNYPLNVEITTDGAKPFTRK